MSSTPRTTLRNYWTYSALFVLQSLALWIFVAPAPAAHGFPLDDAWIHQVVARTFAQTGTLGFTEGQYGAAATSHLWAAMLAVNYAIVHADPYVFTTCINVALSLAIGQLLLIALRRAPSPEKRETGRDWQRDLGDVIAVSFACAGGNFLWFAYSGMEANLVAFLVLAGIVVYTAPGANAWRSALAAGLFAGLLAVTRPECLLFGPALAAATWVLPRKKRDAVWVMLPWLLLAGAWLAVNFVKTGNAIPPTLAGRRWLWQHGNLGLSKLALLREFGYTLALRLRNYTLGTSATLPFWALVGLSIYAIARLWQKRSIALRLIFCWAAIHIGIYALLLPTPGHGGRYQPLTPLLFLFCGAYGALYLGEQLAWITGARSKSARAFYLRRGFFALASLSPWVGLTAVGLRDWRHDHACAVSHIRWTELGMAELVNRLPPEAKVASFDIGGIGFASKRPILDIGGLSDQATARYLAEGRLWAMFRERGIAYVVLPVTYRDDLPEPMNFGPRLRLFDNPAIGLELVGYRESLSWVWAPGIGATWNSSPRQALYRIHDTGKPGLETPAPVSGDEPVSLSDPGSTLVGTERDMLLYGLRRFAVERHPVALTISPAAQDAPARMPGTWQIVLGGWGVHVVPPSDRAELQADIASAAVAELVRPYVDMADFGGAGRIALYGLARYIRTLDPYFAPMMAPVRGPDSLAGSDGVRETLGAGALIVLAILAFMLSVDRRRRGALPVEQWVARIKVTSRSKSLVTGISSAFIVVMGAALAGCDKPAFETMDLGDEAIRRGGAHLDLSDRNARGKTPLMAAAERGDASLVLALLDSGAKWDAEDGEKRQALHFAVQSGSIAAVRLLLDAGAPPGAPTGASRMTPLHLAIIRGTPEIAALLLERGANVNAKTSWGETPLHLLAANPSRSDAYLPVLAKHGADFDAFDARGFRPVHTATISDNVHLLRAFIEQGKRVDDPSLTGSTPLDLAIAYRCDLAGDLLARNGATTKKALYRVAPLREAMMADDRRRVALIVGSGGDPGHAGHAGDTDGTSP